MIKNRIIFVLVTLFLVGCYLNVDAADRWRIEAESSQIVRNSLVKIVDDVNASSGKAIDIPDEINTNENIISFDFPVDVSSSGQYQVMVRLKAENIYDIGKALRIEVREENILKNYAVAYGLYLKDKTGYQNFIINYDLMDNRKKPQVLIRWTTGGDAWIPRYEGSPDIKIDAFDIVKIGDIPELKIERIFPDRIRYLVNQDGDVSITIKNYSQKEESCELRVELTHDLENSKLLSVRPVKVGAGQSIEVNIPLKHAGLYGYAVTSTLIKDGKVIDKAEEYFTVHNSQYAVSPSFGQQRDEEQPGGLTNGTWHSPFTGIGHTDEELQIAIDASHRERDYTVMIELGRMPGDSFYIAPKEPIWIDAQAVLLMSKREMQKAVSGLKRYGIGCHFYLADLAIGLPAVQILKEHPDWFVYSSDTSDNEQWYNTTEAVRQQEFWDNFDWKKFHEIADSDSPTWRNTPENWSRYVNYTISLAKEVRNLGCVGFFTPNFTLPEVVDYVADQIIASTKMFGWDGLRWDCGNVVTGLVWGTYKPWLDFYGRPLNKTPEEMIEQTVENLKRLKARVRKEFPNFVFGTNFGSWEEVTKYPKLTEELCRDGGWMLNEISQWYNSPTSPYHYWDKYYEVHSNTGELVTSLEGHYNPFACNVWKYSADRLYGTIFILVTKGKPHVIFYNSRMPAGSYQQFGIRFGRFLFDTNLRRIDNPNEIISIESSSKLWWEKSVQRLTQDKKEYLIVHLINPPITSEIETDPTSRLPEPANNSIVSVKIPKGKTKVKAWLLTAESLKLGEEPKTQAVSVEVRVENKQAIAIIPQILYWKMLVFQFE